MQLENTRHRGASQHAHALNAEASSAEESGAIHRPLTSIEPMLSIADLAVILNCSRRLVERLRSAGRVPAPDVSVGKMPRWNAATIRSWIEGGGH